MHHEFTADFPEKVESITSTLLEYGIARRRYINRQNCSLSCSYCS